MKIILCGYNWAGCKALHSLLNRGYEIFVYTHDSPWHIPSLADYCEKEKIPYTFEDISKSILPFTPDAICSIYYRYLIKKPVIDSCHGKIFNLHPSLLPKYRGCSSITWAMINAEDQVGYTYHYIDENADSGRIIYQEAVNLYDFDLQYTAYNRIMFEAMHSFEMVLDLVLDGERGQPQKGEATYFRRGAPYSGVIDPSWDEEMVKRFIRAMTHPPLQSAKYNGKDVKSYSEYLEIKKNVE